MRVRVHVPVCDELGGMFSAEAHWPDDVDDDHHRDVRCAPPPAAGPTREMRQALSGVFLRAMLISLNVKPCTGGFVC